MIEAQPAQDETQERGESDSTARRVLPANINEGSDKAEKRDEGKTEKRDENKADPDEIVLSDSEEEAVAKVKRKKLVAAVKAAKHKSTAAKFELNFFCDGSGHSQANIHEPGAYAVVYTKYNPGSDDDGQTIAVAWTMDIAVDHNNAEGMGILHSLWMAQDRLIDIIESKTIPEDAKAQQDVTVGIFSDSQSCLDVVRSRKARGRNVSVHPNDSMVKSLAERSSSRKRSLWLSGRVLG